MRADIHLIGDVYLKHALYMVADEERASGYQLRAAVHIPFFLDSVSPALRASLDNVAGEEAAFKPPTCPIQTVAANVNTNRPAPGDIEKMHARPASDVLYIFSTRLLPRFSEAVKLTFSTQPFGCNHPKLSVDRNGTPIPGCNGACNLLFLEKGFAAEKIKKKKESLVFHAMHPRNFHANFGELNGLNPIYEMLGRRNPYGHGHWADLMKTPWNLR